jgi:hypothetical protein
MGLGLPVISAGQSFLFAAQIIFRLFVRSDEDQKLLTERFAE